jgi:peptidoglycan/LPS O-acetylase OafA/YrhL
MKYRPEIDGLRAISVLSVLLFHLSAELAPGGFVGVDVFFVISGYLITSLIYSERMLGRFSLVSFYVRRIKRIAPALLATILATLGAGYLILAPGNYNLLAQSSLYALGGASNFFFADNTGYFDPDAATMPLLHTWSLGVEEQFYVVWPALLLMLWRLATKTKISLVISVSILIVASFVAFQLTNIADPKTAFYMPYTRAWELGVGGIIPFLPQTASRFWSHLKRSLPWVGLILIGAAVWSLAGATASMSTEIVMAAFGGFLFIYATEPNSFLHRMLSWAPLVFIGKISYSLYLIHFPMIVLWKHYAETSSIRPELYLPFIAGSALMAALSWRYIEQPCRSAKLGWKPVFAAFAIAEVSLGCLCLSVVFSDGAAARIPQAMLPMRSLQAMWQWPCPSYHLFGGTPRCTGGTAWDKAIAHAAIWGDSNSLHFMPLFDVAAREQRVSISNLYTCAPTVATGYTPRDSAAVMADCDRRHRAAIENLSGDDISLVILAADWHLGIPRWYGIPELRDALSRLIAEISTPGRRIAIVAEVPKWHDDPVPCVFTLETTLMRSPSSRQSCRDEIDGFDKSFFMQAQKASDDMLRSFNGEDGVIVLSPVDNLCSGRHCTTAVAGEFIYADDDHLRLNLKEQTKHDLAQMLGFNDLMRLAKKGVHEP